MELTVCKDMGMRHSKFLGWSPEDRAKALAFHVESNLKCQMCGTADWEWDPKQGGSLRVYEPVEHVCMGCSIKGKAQTNDPNRDTTGITIELTRTDTLESELRRKRTDEERTAEAKENRAARLAAQEAKKAKRAARPIPTGQRRR